MIRQGRICKLRKGKREETEYSDREGIVDWYCLRAMILWAMMGSEVK